MKLKVQITQRDFSDLLYQYLIEHKPSELLTEISKALHCASTALAVNEQELKAEWCSITGRTLEKIAVQAIRDEADFFRKMGD